MSTAALQPLHLLLEQATEERDKLATELRRAEDLLRHNQRQGEQLTGYRSEYTQRWARQFGQGGAIEIVHCYQQFMQRLHEAVAQQQRQIEASERSVQVQRERLLQAELRVASVQRLIDRRQADERLAAHRRDQRQTDETAQHVVQRRLRQRPAPH